MTNEKNINFFVHINGYRANSKTSDYEEKKF